ASVAVLTQYAAQVKALEAAAQAANLEGVLGSEFDYVILSTVRSNSDNKIGFVKEKQRINVSISRLVSARVTGHADAEANCPR
ncbi:hypothetical protein T484DRAFT_1856114, partial [Baffinella frigidus]